MDVVVYTAITDGCDDLKPVPEHWAEEARFMAFMDVQPSDSRGWDVRLAEQMYSDPCRNAKPYKIQPHRYIDSEYSLWLDGCVAIMSPQSPCRLLKSWLSECDIAVFRHRIRSCIYEEAVACIAGQKDDPEIINRQMRHYQELHYPAGLGLHECTVIARRHTAAVGALGDAWHSEIVRFSRRDQLSFDYVAYMHGIRVGTIPGAIDCNPHFLWLPHSNQPASSRALRTPMQPEE